MSPTSNAHNLFLYPFASASGTSVVSDALVFLRGMLCNRKFFAHPQSGDFFLSGCDNPVKWAGLSQLVSVDKMVLGSTEGIGGVDGNP